MRAQAKVLSARRADTPTQLAVVDVTFAEDANRVQQRNQAENLALLRRLALSLLKRHPGKGSVATKRYEAALDTQMLEEILKG